MSDERRLPWREWRQLLMNSSIAIGSVFKSVINPSTGNLSEASEMHPIRHCYKSTAWMTRIIAHGEADDSGVYEASCEISLYSFTSPTGKTDNELIIETLDADYGEPLAFLRESSTHSRERSNLRVSQAPDLQDVLVRWADVLEEHCLAEADKHDTLRFMISEERRMRREAEGRAGG